MLRSFARLICLLLAIGLVAPVVPVAAAPMRHSAPMRPDCTMDAGCCETGALCSAACADRCLVTMPTAPVLAGHGARTVVRIARSGVGLSSHRHTPEPPVPRQS